MNKEQILEEFPISKSEEIVSTLEIGNANCVITKTNANSFIIYLKKNGKFYGLEFMLLDTGICFYPHGRKYVKEDDLIIEHTIKKLPKEYLTLKRMCKLMFE